jgi:hypothetical protein
MLLGDVPAACGLQQRSSASDQEVYKLRLCESGQTSRFNVLIAKRYQYALLYHQDLSGRPKELLDRGTSRDTTLSTFDSIELPGGRLGVTMSIARHYYQLGWLIAIGTCPCNRNKTILRGQ